MSQTMTRTQIYIEPDVLAQAKLKAQTQGFNLSQYLRKLLKDDVNNLSIKNSEVIKPKKINKITPFSPSDRTVRDYSGNHNSIYDYKL